MKKEGKLIGFLMALVMLSAVFSGCVTQKSTVTVTQEQPPPANQGTSPPTTTDTTPQTGSPMLLASISYNTETINKTNHIYLSIQNYGSGKATNVAIVISNEYYSGFTLESVDPQVRIDGNRFYVGDIAAGEKYVLNIYLKAKQSGVYSGTISYTYDGIESSGKIKDVTTKVP